MGNFNVKKFMVENKLTTMSRLRTSLDENQERDEQYYEDQDQEEIVMQLAKEAIDLIYEQPGTPAHTALQSVLEDYIDENDLE